jgi:GxxExxY protein
LHDIDELASIAIDCGFHLHKEIGPGVLESVYGSSAGGTTEEARTYGGAPKGAASGVRGIDPRSSFRVDLLVSGRLIIEVKSVEKLSPLHSKQLLTYIRLAKQPVGLLMNFGGETFRDGLRPIVNGAEDRCNSTIER